jgi:hypothetical protein
LKKLIFIFIFLGFLNSSFAQNCVWAKCALSTGTASSWEYSNCTDKFGNIYVTGFFNGTVVFGTQTLTSIGLYNTFLVKYDSNGNVLWVKGGYNSNRTQAMSVACDRSANVYITGYFDTPNAVFDSYTLTNTGTIGEDVFLVKYDQTGNLLWAKNEGGIGNANNGTHGSEFPWATFIDTIGNVFITGYSTSMTLTVGSNTLINTGYNPSGGVGAYIAKYDSLGSPLWAKGLQGWALGYGGTVDRFGNSYMTGGYGTSVSIGSTTLTNQVSGGGMFIAKYDPNGNVQWAISENVDYGFHLITNNAGDLFVTGGAVSSNTPSIGTFTLGSVGSFVAKYNSNGIAQWAKGFGTQSLGHFLATDASGLYATGYLGSSSVSPLVIDNTTINIPAGFTDPNYLIRFDFFGNLGWVHVANGSGSGGNDKSGVSTDQNGNIYYSANFEVSPFAVGAHTLQLTGTRNVYLAKFHFTDVGIKTNSPYNSFNIFPSPADKEFYWGSPENLQYNSCAIYDATGKLIREIDPDHVDKINVETLDPGIYFVQIEEKNGNIFVKKLCISR